MMYFLLKVWENYIDNKLAAVRKEKNILLKKYDIQQREA